MAVNRDEIDRLLLDRVVAEVRCVICHHPFRHEDVAIVERHGDTWVLVSFCPHCETAGMIVAALDLDEAEEIYGELTPEEWEAYASLPPISDDDLLDLHEFLKRFDGDFRRLFGEE